MFFDETFLGSTSVGLRKVDFTNIRAVLTFVYFCEERCISLTVPHSLRPFILFLKKHAKCVEIFKDNDFIGYVLNDTRKWVTTFPT